MEKLNGSNFIKEPHFSRFMHQHLSLCASSFSNRNFAKECRESKVPLWWTCHKFVIQPVRNYLPSYFIETLQIAILK